LPSGSLASGERGAVPPAAPDGQAATPYLEAVTGYVRREPDRFHVPGHKGGSGADPEVRSTLGGAAVLHDVPQDIEGIDVGPSPTPSERAELLAAEAYGAAQSWFLTNGATQGNHALCLALARERPVVVQRNSHASVVDGLVLSGGRPHFAVPEYDEELGMALCVTPQALADALDRAPHAGAAFVVSPTYYGASADIASCARVCHECRAALLVDQAWGPHFGFHAGVPGSALALGADAMLTSTHKIAGSLTQSAMLHVADSPWIDRGTLARAVRLVRSTSPSSLLLASLDAARRQLAVHGEQLLAGTLERAARARAAIEAVPGCRIVPDAVGRWSSVADWDPMRVVVDLRATGASGHAVAAALRHPSHAPVQVELATHATIVLVLGINEPPKPLLDFPGRLAATLTELAGGRSEVAVARAPQPLSGEPSLTPRDAWLAETEHAPVGASIGRVSAEAVAGYPPGIPALMPGERITAAVIEHLRELVLAGVRLHGASDPRLETIAVVVQAGEVTGEKPRRPPAPAREAGEREQS
jgi:arginine decarboxylase